MRLLRRLVSMADAVFYAAITLMPWPLRRIALHICYGFEIHPSARIALAWIRPRKLIMGPGSRIGALTVCKGLEELRMGEDCIIGRLNWITAYPLNSIGPFSHKKDRFPALTMGAQSAITNRHIIDCTDTIRVGSYTTVAGFCSQMLTHSIDLKRSRQSCAPIEIGTYCFVGTNVVILGGTTLPAYSILGAKSLLTKAFEEERNLYSGVPAARVHLLSNDYGYFNRSEGVVR